MDANNVIMGNLALQGTIGVNMIVKSRSCLFSMVFVEYMAGTEQPLPRINGIKALPDSPNFRKSLSNRKAILVM